MGYGQLYMFSSILKGPEQNKCIPTRAKVGNMYIHIDIYVYIYIYIYILHLYGYNTLMYSPFSSNTLITRLTITTTPPYKKKDPYTH